MLFFGRLGIFIKVTGVWRSWGLYLKVNFYSFLIFRDKIFETFEYVLYEFGLERVFCSFIDRESVKRRVCFFC